MFLFQINYLDIIFKRDGKKEKYCIMVEKCQEDHKLLLKGQAICE